MALTYNEDGFPVDKRGRPYFTQADLDKHLAKAPPIGPETIERLRRIVEARRLSKLRGDLR